MAGSFVSCWNASAYMYTHTLGHRRPGCESWRRKPLCCVRQRKAARQRRRLWRRRRLRWVSHLCFCVGWRACKYVQTLASYETDAHNNETTQAAALEEALKGAKAEAASLQGVLESEKAHRQQLEHALAEKDEALGAGCVCTIYIEWLSLTSPPHSPHRFTRLCRQGGGAGPAGGGGRPRTVGAGAGGGRAQGPYYTISVSVSPSMCVHPLLTANERYRRARAARWSSWGRSCGRRATPCGLWRCVLVTHQPASHHMSTAAFFAGIRVCH